MVVLYRIVLFFMLANAALADETVDVQTVDVSCLFSFDEEACTLYVVRSESEKPINLNIINADGNKNTTRLEIILGNLRQMPLNLFQLFPKLEELKIEHNALEVITKESLIGGQNLKGLYLVGNKITSIEPHTFDGMDKLRTIQLRDNRLRTIETDAFVGANNLKSLDLNLNEISTINDGAFNIPTLEEIDLRRNKLQTLADDAFINCSELQRILVGNELTRIGKSINSLPKLELLYFDNNNVRIQDLDFYAIASIPAMNFYSAIGVGLTWDDLEPPSASGNYNVKYLDVSRNNLSNPDILQRLSKFRSVIALNIGENNFTTINDIENIFEIFPNLGRLGLDALPCKDDVIRRLRNKFGFERLIFGVETVYWYLSQFDF